MPTLNKQFSLTVTPEQFINACDENEIQELHLLLNSPRFDGIFSESKNADVQEVSESEAAGDLWKELVRLFGDQQTEAIQIMKEIKSKTPISFLEILEMMHLYKKLEVLRVKALVRKPQEQ